MSETSRPLLACQVYMYMYLATHTLYVILLTQWESQVVPQWLYHNSFWGWLQLQTRRPAQEWHRHTHGHHRSLLHCGVGESVWVGEWVREGGEGRGSLTYTHSHTHTHTHTHAHTHTHTHTASHPSGQVAVISKSASNPPGACGVSAIVLIRRWRWTDDLHVLHQFNHISIQHRSI